MRYSTLAPILVTCFAFSGSVLAQDGPDSVLRGTKQFSRKVVISGLDGPWELTWGPDRMLWVTERTGKRDPR
jgi:glucose/arabinose dehydrogenase